MNQYDPHEIGLRAEALRRGLGLSQQELSNCSGISQQFISRAEIGMTNMKIASLYKLANALDTSVIFLLTGQREKEIERRTQQELFDYLKDRIQYSDLTTSELLLVEDVIEALMNFILRNRTHQGNPYDLE